ncbi:uncharacterized protein PAC_16610 [Phialocephala subalpina]|uniref:Uncharacterized protein n=1 Tax=Phialocephala subalpina TaxID=576137 RepID=A0A1L7XNU9_9HELO|nr:uncharacterized protein PAC_16610 [Phialocephala subalpina]
MLSSQVLLVSKTSVLPTSSRVLPTVISRSGSLPRRPRPYQQVRAFRIGLWSSYLDANFQREFRRRQRVVKHKYIEALNRKLSWDRHFPMHLRHNGLKSFMCSAWRGQDSRPSGRWVNMEDLNSMKERPKENNERSRGVEDEKEQNLYRLLDNHHRFIRAKARMFPGRSTCYSTSWTSRSSQMPAATPTDDMSASSTLYGSEGFRKRFQTRDSLYEDQTEYDIDPITNRKVPKKPSEPANEGNKSYDIPVKTFKGYRSQFKTFEPPETQSDKTETQLEHTATTDHPSQYNISPHTQEAPAPEIESKEVDPLEKYDEKVGFNSGRQYNTAEMDIDYSCPVQKGLKSFDDKISNEAAANTSTGEISPKQGGNHDGLETFDKKAKYEGREYFGSAYDEVDQVDPVQKAIRTYHSSKGLRHSRVVHPKKGDEDKVIQAKREYDHSNARRAYLRDQQANRLLQSIQNYEEIMAAERAKGQVSGVYGHEQLHPLLKAIREYEASELDKKTNPCEGAAQDQSDPVLRALQEYKSRVSRVEAKDGRTALHIEQEAVDPLLSAIDGYEAFVQSGGRCDGEHGDKVEECLKKYDAKVNFYRKPYQVDENNSGEGESSFQKYIVKPSLADATIERLHRLRESYFMKGGEQATTPKSWAHLPQKIRDLFAKEAKSDSKNVEEFTSDRVGRLELSSESRETEEAKMVRRSELEQDFAATKVPGVSSEVLESARRRALELRSEQNKLRNDATHIEGIVDAKLKKLENEPQPESKSKKMTGNFVRDFPEEFETAWTTADGSSGSLTRKTTPDREIEAGVQQNEQAYISGLGSQEASSRRPDVERLETSLNRTVSRDAAKKNTPQTKVNPARQGEGDPSASVLASTPSKQDEPLDVGASAHTIKQQLQKEKNTRKELDRDLVREVRSIYESTYGTISARHRQVPTVSEEKTAVREDTPALDTAAETQPAVYKILAYDPTMQSISTAETTSIVSDASGPLTPAEVLLRLSNPAKFFPHFAPLQRQGYEIVSGSGDVLVFRKVREGAPPGVEKTSSTTAEEKEPEERKSSHVNPIDGMTRGPIVATGDFASPTGFVNYDIPRGSEPPFKSNIDVRREEPVFSGKKNWDDDEGSGRKKRGVGKTVLIGAGWLGACSYAIGVVADYFKTGGSDGMGPKGF